MANYSISRHVGNAVRFAEVVQVFIRYGFANLLQRLGVYESFPAKTLRRLRIIEKPEAKGMDSATRLRMALTELGPTFVKLGQILSTRPDLVGMAMARELGQLQDRVTPLPFDKIRPVIEESLGGAVEELFLDFNTDPVASASLSQVYRATLKTGQAVAVKVQRPGTPEVVQADIRLLRRIAEWAELHMEDVAWMDPVGTVDEFERTIKREMDFTIEAQIIGRFRGNYEGNEEVFIPQTYPGLSSAVVLTMDWVDGVRIDATGEFGSRNCDPSTLAVVGGRALCEQVFVHQLFHADPHPGNLWALRDNNIAFLDYGMVGHLEKTDVVAMADLLFAIFQEDTESCVQTLLLFTKSGEIEDPEALEHELADFIAFEAQAVVAGGQVGKALDKMVSLLRRYHLQLAPRFSLLLKALGTIESTARALDPDIDMVPIIRPYVERILRQRHSFGQISRELQQDLLAALRTGRGVPRDIRQIMRLVRRGRVRVHLHHEKLERLASVTDRASNRIAFGVITGSLIVGSSMLVASGTGFYGFGAGGYIIAGLLGLSLVISILRSRNY